MLCPKCHGTGKIKFSYTQRYTVFNNCDYEGCVGGIVNCCDGIQEQPNNSCNSDRSQYNVTGHSLRRIKQNEETKKHG